MKTFLKIICTLLFISIFGGMFFLIDYITEHPGSLIETIFGYILITITGLLMLILIGLLLYILIWSAYGLIEEFFRRTK